jgi:cell division septal protein FtsQ
VKEGSTKRQNAVWVFITGGVLIAAVIIALYTPWLQFCDVREVVVSGNQNATAADLVSLSQLHRGQTIFSVPATLVRRRLEQHPWVKQASVRIVIAWAQHPDEDARVAVAEGGVIVGRDEAVTSSLELIGAETSGWERGDRIHDPRVGELIVALSDNECWLAVRSMDVTDLHSIELILENDARVLLGDMAETQNRLVALDALCREIEIDGYELIDVRFGGEATLVPRKVVRR